MEPTEEVLVVIQAESGEEIAVPLAALDEQHQEVILDSDGSPSAHIALQSDQNGQNGPEDGVSTNGTTSNDISDMDVDTPAATTPEKKPVVLKPKQKRKEKLVILPLFEDENNLEFQIVDQTLSPTREEAKRKPRKEYRTKRRLAALQASNQEQQQTSQPPTPKEAKREVVEQTPPPPPPPARPAPAPTPSSSPPKEPDVSPPQLSQRRTRLSNSCRVATEKMYKCPECDFSTERINNIILHMKETCPKIKREAPNA